VGRVASTLQRTAPLLVTLGTLAFLLTRVDLAATWAHVHARAVLVLVPALLAYGAITLWIEALTLVRLVPPESSHLGTWACARIKAATYPLGLLHYTLGAGSLALLLRRHGGIGVASAAGIVLLISVFDLGILLGLTAVGAALLGARAPALQAGVVVAGTIGLALGFALLRSSRPVGPLERLRQLEVFRAARQAPLRLLGELLALRLLFIMTFVALGGAALAAFSLSVPLGDLVVNVAGVSLVAALPIAVSGLGTGQVAFVYLFRHWAEPEALLACSLTLSAGLILLRAGIGIAFSRELMREAYVASREAAA
jgi:hypothetical protein